MAVHFAKLRLPRATSLGRGRALCMLCNAESLQLQTAMGEFELS
jgi:hypothetical protein